MKLLLSSTLVKMADEDTQNVTVEEKANEEIEPLDEPSQDEDLDALLIEDKDEDQIDPDIVIGEKDDLLGGGIDSEEQFEVLDSVGDTASEEKKNDQNEAKDTEKQDKGTVCCLYHHAMSINDKYFTICGAQISYGSIDS